MLPKLNLGNVFILSNNHFINVRTFINAVPDRTSIITEV